MIGLAAVVAGILFGLWFERWTWRRAEERRKLKACLPRRVG